jgi:Nif-specific regulatory protein
MTLGNRIGRVFLLSPEGANRIGRGTECSIHLLDPISSRVHAVLEHQDGNWLIRDASSRNGTYVNGQKIDEATLADGHTVRVGGSEFTFHLTTEPPTLENPGSLNQSHTIVKELALGAGDTGSMALAALRDPDQAKDLLLLYQLSNILLGCGDPGEVVRVSLELLHSRTAASVVGFLWADEEGALKPKMVMPEDRADKVGLSESLTELVSRQCRAVWIARQETGDPSKSLAHYADALCVPLLDVKTVIGAVHVYLERGRFRQADFDFTLSAATLMGLALVRARRQTTLETSYQSLVAQSPGHDELVGNSAPMLELKSRIARIARAPGCVLIRGESGTGKELVARAIHRASSRHDRPLLTVNCAAIPAELMESQLFGHKAGSFTSADRDHVGYFQQADLGTLFLDEVGELTLEGQAKLLRILEGHPFLPVGGTQQIQVDVRVIAATNQDLQKFVQQRQFREDLYYRLNVFELHIPPLRERGSDIGLLINFFFDHFRRQHGRGSLRLAEESRKKLLGYRWPGNVRQLRNVLDSAVVLAEQAIEPGDLALRDSGPPELESLRIDVWERKLIVEALKRAGKSVPDAAQLLGISRATLYRKLDEYEIER